MLSTAIDSLAMFDLALLAVQLGCAIVQVRMVIALLEWAAANESRSQGLLDIGLPLVISIPCIAAMVRCGSQLGGLEHAVIGGAIAIAMLGVGVSILRSAAPPVQRTQVALVCATGAILLLLALLDHLPIGVGQTSLAAGAVLLWFNTPHEKPMESGTNPTVLKTYSARVLFVSTITHATIVATMNEPMRPVAVGLAVLCAVVTMLLAAWMSRGGVQIALWTVVYGVLFGIGLLSISRVLGATVLRGTGGGSESFLQIAYGVSRGFSTHALEGAVLIGLPVLLLAVSLAARFVRLILGGGLLILAIGLLAYRFLAIG